MKISISNLGVFVSLVCFSSLGAAKAQTHGGGNGGGAYVCSDSAGNISYAELEDFVEGRLLHRFEIDSDQDVVPLNLIDALKGYDVLLYQKVLSSWSALRSEFYAGLKPVELHVSQTSNKTIKSTVCPDGSKSKFATVARYEEAGLIVNRLIFEKMPPADQDGLIFHEAIFKATRELYRDTDSARARKIVAALFSKNATDQLRQMRVLSLNEMIAFGPQYLDEFSRRATENTTEVEIINKFNLTKNKAVLRCEMVTVYHNENNRVNMESYHLILSEKDSKLRSKIKGSWPISSNYLSGQCGQKNTKYRLSQDGALICYGWFPLTQIHECRPVTN